MVHVVDNVVKMCFTDEHRCFVIEHYYLSGCSYVRVRNTFFDQYDETSRKCKVNRSIVLNNKQILYLQKTGLSRVPMPELVEEVKGRLSTHTHHPIASTRSKYCCFTLFNLVIEKISKDIDNIDVG